MSSTLRGSPRPLAELFDVAMLDLDGVVYVGADAVDGAPAALAAARQAGTRLAFVTNNAARPPEVVAAHLTDLGIAASADEVITSSQAAARYLAERLPAGARVLVVGTTGLDQALRERGLTPVADATGSIDAVVQGYSPDMTWRLLAEGAVGINRGVLWVATNIDPTVPSPRGPLPGNGSLVAALRLATGAEPVVTGKPDPTMHRETVLRTGAQRPVVVGDRLDTDIEGANAVGCPSLLVFTGVTRPADVLTAIPDLRPTYLAADVSGLLAEHPDVDIEDDGARCRGWRATRTPEGLVLSRSAAAGGAGVGGAASSVAAGGSGRTVGAEVLSDSALDALRALCVAAWGGGGWATSGRHDEEIAPPPNVTGNDSDGEAVLLELGLASG